MSRTKTTSESAPPPKSGAQRPASNALGATIAQAQRGRVNVSAEKAVQMAAQLYSEGNFAQAERVCWQIVEARPANADAHNILGAALQALGRGSEAVAQLRIAVKLAPQAASLHANLGEILRQNGDSEEATAELEKAIKLDPQNAQALNNLGILEYDKGRFDSAVDYYRRALAIAPGMAEALNNLGNALRVTGDIDGAINAYQDALMRREAYPEAYNNLGTLLQQDRRFDEAEHALRKAIAQRPGYVEAHNNLANLYVAQKKDVEALRVLGDVLKIAPTNPQTLLITARIQLRRANFPAAEQATRVVLQQQPDNAEALSVLGQILHETDRYDEAIGVLEKSVQANPRNPEALNFYGVALKSVGRLDDARDYILKALRLNDSMFGAYANLNDLVDFSKGEGEELFNRMDAIFEAATDPEAEQLLPLHFAYAKALDDRGEHERALNHYITGGRMKRAQLDYNEKETFGFFDSIRQAFPKQLFEEGRFKGLDDERPVFIIGMPRSGSTLVEQILSSHPDVHGAGEVKYLSQAIGKLRDRLPSLPRYPQMMAKITPAQLDMVGKKYLEALTAGAGGAKRVTDKLLTNYFFVGLIHLLYPKAKFVNTLRDPVDTCLSGFTKLFKDDMPHSYDLTELGRYYCKYRELMEHWQAVLPAGVLTTVRYEDVVADTEGQAKALIDFIGLEWDPRCLEFHKSDRPVKTASVAQVRKPIYKTAVKRWKKYGAGLQPLVDAVGETAAPPRRRKAAAKA
ncbi:MAG: tetratricopeptide repeat-containing sulfotransferase family protein [Sphingomicrobium sp.]